MTLIRFWRRHSVYTVSCTVYSVWHYTTMNANSICFNVIQYTQHMHSELSHHRHHSHVASEGRHVTAPTCPRPTASFQVTNGMGGIVSELVEKYCPKYTVTDEDKKSNRWRFFRKASIFYFPHAITDHKQYKKPQILLCFTSTWYKTSKFSILLILPWVKSTSCSNKHRSRSQATGYCRLTIQHSAN